MKYLPLVILVCLASLRLPAQEVDTLAATVADTLSAASDTTAKVDPVQSRVDSLRQESDMEGPVSYSAGDSISFDIRTNKMLLYRQGKIKYTNLELQAMDVEVDMESQVLRAKGRENEEGELEGNPTFNQDGQQYEAKEMAYNFKSGKGRVSGGRAQEGEGYILASVAKYMPDGSFYGKSGKYTTCDNPDPHFYIQSRKLKVTKDNQIISGPLNLVIADVPLPIIIPFGFVPNQEGHRSGIVLPVYGEADERGFFLQRMGYYWYVNDNLDLLFDGDIYSKGGWRLGLGARYNFRYKFNGNFKFNYAVRRFNEATDPDFSRENAWSLSLSHNQPINRNTRLSASVNLSSSARYQRSISFNPSDFFQNNLTSSITFQKSFANLPFALNMSVRHQQDLNKRTMSIDLPEFAFNVNRITPFKRVDGKGLDFLRQFGFNYNFRARNNLTGVPDSLFFDILLNPADTVNLSQVENGDTVLVRRPASEFFRAGMQHTTSFSTSIKVLQYINLTPSFNYNEYWYFNTVRKAWNPAENRVENITRNGFTRGYSFNAGIGLSTNFFGIYQLPNTKRQFAFRQRFTPTISYNITPDFSDPRFGFYEQVQTNEQGDVQTYSIFENGIFGGPGRGESQAISFGMNSVVEMKYRSKESFDPEFEEGEDPFVRTNLIDNIGFSSSYNFAADSFRLAPFALRARASILKNKISLNTSATLDPYAVEYTQVPIPEAPSSTTWRRVNRLMIAEQGKLGRITRAQVSLNASFQSSRGKKKNRPDPNASPGEQEVYEEVERTRYQYVDFDIPWSLNLRYNLSINKPGLDPATITQTVNVDGDFNFTPKWKVGIQSGYDFTRMDITQTRITVYRDLHCWELSFSWVPFGTLQSYSLTLNVKSPVLRDLRLNKNSNWQDRFQPL